MKSSYIYTVILGMLMSSCNPLQKPEKKQFIELNSSNTKPTDIQTVVFANNQFAIDFLKQQNHKLPNQNIFFSPYSLTSSTSLLYEGASGTTKKEIAAVFYFPDKITLRKGYAGIYNPLNKNNDYIVQSANAIWFDKSLKIHPEYGKNIADFYAATSDSLNFLKKPEKSAELINNFVAKKTHGSIKQSVNADELQNSRIILLNTIYLNAAWAAPFSESLTKTDDFHLANGKMKSVPFMHKWRKRIHYFENESLQMVSLPYKGYGLSALFVLPKPKQDIYKLLDTNQLNQWRSSLEPILVNLSIPKFKMEQSFELSGTLSSMGMQAAFSDKAEFSKISNSKIKIDKVIHKAFIDLNEEGTVAGAVTENLGSVAAAVRQEPKEFKADRPFLFIIQHNSTGNILFMGSLYNPH